MSKTRFTRWFSEIGMDYVPMVGGKNVSLGEMSRELAPLDIRVPDGFSVGSNDLTQLVLGVDRDSERVAALFDERDETIRKMCAALTGGAHRAGPDLPTSREPIRCAPARRGRHGSRKRRRRHVRVPHEDLAGDRRF